MKSREEARQGFTLLEALASMSIVAILLSLLAPAVTFGIRSSRQAYCYQNMREIWRHAQEYSADYYGYVVPAATPSGYMKDPDGDIHDPLNFQSTMYPAHSTTFANNEISFDDQLLAYRGVALTEDFTPRAISAARVFQCPSGAWGFTQKEYAGLGEYTPHPNWLPTDPLDNPNARSWTGHYMLNLHVNHSPYSGSFHSWDGATWRQGAADPRATFEDSVYGRRTAMDQIGLKCAQWQDPGGTIFLFENWRNWGWSRAANCGSFSWAGAPLQAGMNAGNIDAFDPPEKAVQLWQEKHNSKANLLFCDGHSDTMRMQDTVGTNWEQKMSSWLTVRGMWTNAQGD